MFRTGFCRAERTARGQIQLRFADVLDDGRKKREAGVYDADDGFETSD